MVPLPVDTEFSFQNFQKCGVERQAFFVPSKKLQTHTHTNTHTHTCLCALQTFIQKEGIFCPKEKGVHTTHTPNTHTPNTHTHTHTHLSLRAMNFH